MWVAGVDRFEGKLGLVFQGMDGVASFGPIEDLRGESHSKWVDKARVRIHFNEHELIPTDVYLGAIGAHNLGSDGQRCYEFQTDAGPVVIPSQLLVVALVGATTLMRAPLLTPHGPTALMTAYRGDSEADLVIEATPKRMRQFQTDRWSTVCRMNWILTFPTAARAWSSVYANALGGRLDVTLPNANATAILRGLRASGKLWVTSLDLLTLTAKEAPHEFTTGSPTHWCLIEQVIPQIDQRVTHLIDRYPPLTAQQWDALGERVPFLAKRLQYKAPKISACQKLELIRQHLLTGLKMRELPGDGLLLRASRVYIAKFKAAGTWPEISQVLRSTC